METSLKRIFSKILAESHLDISPTLKDDPIDKPKLHTSGRGRVNFRGTAEFCRKSSRINKNMGTKPIGRDGKFRPVLFVDPIPLG